MISLVGGRSPTVDDILEDEFAKALSCKERAFFYATSVSKKPRGQERSSETHLPASISSVKANADSRFSAITSNYAKAWEILTHRITQVRIEHDELLGYFKHPVLKFLRIKTPDRDSEVAWKSVESLRKRFNNRFNALAKDPDPPQKGQVPDIAVVERYCLAWDSLNGMCKLFMEEISFLSQRIENLQNTRNVITGWGLSLFIFGAPIVTSLIISSCTPQKDTNKDKPENIVILGYPSPQPVISPTVTPGGAQAPDPALRSQLSQIQQTLSEIKAALNLDARPELGAIRSSIDSVRNSIDALKPSIDGLKPSPSITPPVHPEPTSTKDTIDLSGVTKEISSLREAVEHMASQKDTQNIKAEIASLAQSIRALTKKVENIKPQHLNGWGVGRFRTQD